MPSKYLDCPRCSGLIPDDLNAGAYPGALSRWDNATEICSQCGFDEAMLDWKHNSYREGGSSWLDPYTGDKKWETPTAALTLTEINNRKRNRDG